MNGIHRHSRSVTTRLIKTVGVSLLWLMLVWAFAVAQSASASPVEIVKYGLVFGILGLVLGVGPFLRSFLRDQALSQ